MLNILAAAALGWPSCAVTAPKEGPELLRNRRSGRVGHAGRSADSGGAGPEANEPGPRVRAEGDP